MLKTIARLEHKIGERIYHMLCDADSPLGEVKEALCRFMAHISMIEDAAAKAAEAAKAEAEAPKVEEVKEAE